MSKPKVLVTRRIPSAGLSVLQKQFEVHMVEKGRPLTKIELRKLLKGKDALLCMLTDRIDESLLKANRGLKIVSNFAVGYDNIDLAAASKLGIPVTNTPGALTDAVAEFTVAMAVSAARRLTEGERFLREGKYKGWAPEMMTGHALIGKTAGILGLGRIGLRVAKILSHGFGMRVLYHDVRRATSEIEAQYGIEFAELEHLLSSSDLISVHVPLLPTTKHYVNAKMFKLMKKTAILVNTSRGPVVDEKALVVALKKGQIGAAALDVYEFEPKLVPGLKALPNVVLTPHMASAVDTARDEMAVMAAQSIVAAFEGKKLDRLVNADYLAPIKR